MGIDPDIWFPTKGKGKSNVGHEAKVICGSCPVARDCLTYAVSRREKFGIWGGCGGTILRALRTIWVNERECDGYGWENDCDCKWCETIFEVIEHGKSLNANGDGATHGLRVTYARGCRCFPCRLVASQYNIEQRRNAA